MAISRSLGESRPAIAWKPTRTSGHRPTTGARGIAR